MTQEERVTYIDSCIKEAEKVAGQPYNSPVNQIWERRVKRFISNEYDEDMAEIFVDSLSWGGVIKQGMAQQNHHDAIHRAIDFLESLKAEPVPEKPTGVLGKLLQVEKEQKQSSRISHVKPTHTEYHIYGGTVHTGNGNIEQNVTVKDIIIQIRDEIEKLPESQEKKSVMQSLKTLTTNETFASVAGTLIGTIFNKMINPTAVQ